MKDSKSKAQHSPSPAAAKPKDSKAAKQDKQDKQDKPHKVEGNAPFTTKWGMTSPKFGSAGSGGAEDSPGPEAD